MIAEITGLNFHDIDKIQDTLCPKNTVTLKAEPHPKNPETIAFAAYCKGYKIGYLPELESMRKIYLKSKDYAEQRKNADRGKAVKAVLNQIKIDMDATGQSEWTGQVATIKYTNEKQTISFDKYSELSQAGNANGYRISILCVNFDWVECEF